MTEERMNELFARIDETEPYCGVCVGSWKAYNEGGEHCLGTYWRGSFYINFLDLNGSEELEEVLEYLGWSELEREELFVQDYMSDFLTIDNCDYENPMDLANLIRDNLDTINQDAKKLDVLQTELGMSFEDALDRADDYAFYPDCSVEEYEEYLFDECYQLPEGFEWLRDYIDWESLARDDCYMGNISETRSGVLVRY